MKRTLGTQLSHETRSKMRSEHLRAADKRLEELRPVQSDPSIFLSLPRIGSVVAATLISGMAKIAIGPCSRGLLAEARGRPVHRTAICKLPRV